MTQATTAAEALKQSKSGIVQSIYADYRYRFNETLKVWESRSLNQNDWGLCPNGNMFFANPEFIPYDEPDTELLEAQKLVGTWLQQKELYHARKVFSVGRRLNNQLHFTDENGHNYLLKNWVPVWVSEPRCCVEEPPSSSGYYLVVREDKQAVIKFYSIERSEWFWENSNTENAKWYALPQGGK